MTVRRARPRPRTFGSPPPANGPIGDAPASGKRTIIGWLGATLCEPCCIGSAVYLGWAPALILKVARLFLPRVVPNKGEPGHFCFVHRRGFLWPCACRLPDRVQRRRRGGQRHARG